MHLRSLFLIVTVSWLAACASGTAADRAEAATKHAQAQQSNASLPDAKQPVITDHVGTFNGVRVHYTATFATHVLKNKARKPAATASTIAYIRSNVAHPERRPVLFVFNGGPGASTSPLHMDALGPYRWVDTGDRAAFPQGKWQDNPDSPLDAVDIVFIDPPGTGFNRPLPAVDPSQFYTSDGDAKAFKSIIAAWLKANHREDSPRYLMGESYGTTRAALILKDSNDLPFNGVLLIALVGDAQGHVMPYVTSIPTMAAGAWYFHKIDRHGRSVGEIFRRAETFARTRYAPALIEGSRLPLAQKHELAVAMSKLIGLPAALIEKNDLRISKNVYMFNLLKDKGLRTGMLDVRVTGPLEPGQLGGLDDPALGVVPGGKRKPGAPPLTPQSIGPVTSDKMTKYMHDVLHVSSAKPYIAVNFSVNAAWKYTGAKSAIADLGKVMQKNPHLRLFWAAGYYDLTTPAFQARYTLDQNGIPAKQLTAAYFPGPHGVYAGAANLKRFDAEVRRFVTAKAQLSAP